MSVYLKDDKVVIKGSSVATSNDCCCATGACCHDTNCDIESENDCNNSDGTYQGDDTVCDPNPCGESPTGACCTDEVCSVLSEADCASGGGNYYGDGSTCAGIDCSVPPGNSGACCYDAETCVFTAEADCFGAYQGDGSSCDPNPCTLPLCNCALPFAAFDGSGRKFRTQTQTTSGSQVATIGTTTITVTWNTTSIASCTGDCTCDGGGEQIATDEIIPSNNYDCTFTAVNCNPSCPDGNCEVPALSGCSFVGDFPPCSGFGRFGVSNLAACASSCSSSESVISATEKSVVTTCTGGTCGDVSSTANITLSDECVVSFSPPP